MSSGIHWQTQGHSERQLLHLAEPDPPKCLIFTYIFNKKQPGQTSMAPQREILDPPCIFAVCTYRYVITLDLRSKYDMLGHYFRFAVRILANPWKYDITLLCIPQLYCMQIFNLCFLLKFSFIHIKLS